MPRVRPAPAEFSRFELDFTPLRQQRRHKNMSQGDLARVVGVSRLTISRTERYHSNPTKHLMVAISRALGTPEHLLYYVRDLESDDRT
jgi:transcriptional regulator with XRE-family HTH domain